MTHYLPVSCFFTLLLILECTDCSILKILAVDVHVGGDLFHNAILGYLKAQEKTILLVTHAVHLLSYMDRVIVLSNGCVVSDGTYSQLLETGGQWKDLIEELDVKAAHKAHNVSSSEIISCCRSLSSGRRPYRIYKRTRKIKMGSKQQI
jgi:ABC-type uncharacterized transport system ATPase subunit